MSALQGKLTNLSVICVGVATAIALASDGNAQDKKGTAKDYVQHPPKPLPKEVQTAWLSAGAQLGWMAAQLDGGHLYFDLEMRDSGRAGELPSFFFSRERLQARRAGFGTGAHPRVRPRFPRLQDTGLRRNWSRQVQGSLRPIP
jgi:hypothetical protein